MRRHRWARWGLVFACWSLLGLLSGSRLYWIYASTGREALLGPSLTVGMLDWYSWGALAPAILWLARRCPFEAGRWGRAVLVHLPAGVLLTGLKMVLEHGANQAIFYSPARRLALLAFHPNFLTYLAILGVVLALDFNGKYRAHELRASRLEAQLSQAQLQVLRMQLQPHFLFNTLHAISTLMRRDLAGADRMIALLSDLLRTTLERGDRHRVTLREEMDLIRLYLEILRIRFPDRLAVRLDVPPDTLAALVPTMILQPLVENAVRHGISGRPEGGRLEISAAARDGRLRLAVRDDGPGLSRPPHNGPGPSSPQRNGLGLSNTRSRLEAIYGAQHRFDLRSDPRGLEAIIEIPLAVGPGEGQGAS